MLVVIPSRLASSRLPEKPLARIGRDPLIIHCWRRAIEADVGPVWVATDSPEIVDLVQVAGGNAVLTTEQCASGTDRVAAAVEAIDPDREHAFVVNQQGDMPFVHPEIVRAVAAELVMSGADMATACQRFEYVEADGGDFCRKSGRRHIGVYGYKRAALERFTSLPVAFREADERLEQLRAVEAGFTISFTDVETFPTEINTPADLEEARQIARCLA